MNRTAIACLLYAGMGVLHALAAWFGSVEGDKLLATSQAAGAAVWFIAALVRSCWD